MFGWFKKKEPEKTPEKEYLVITLRKKFVETKEVELITGQHILTFLDFNDKVREIVLDYSERLEVKQKVYISEINEPKKFSKDLFVRQSRNRDGDILEIYDVISFGSYGTNMMYHSRPDNVLTSYTLENIHRNNQIQNSSREEFIPTKMEVLHEGKLINVKHWIDCSFNIINTKTEKVDIYHYIHDGETLTESQFNTRLEEYNRISSN